MYRNDSQMKALVCFVVFALSFFFHPFAANNISVGVAQELPQKVADYRFLGNLENSLAPGSPLVNISVNNTFATETIDGDPVSVLQFPAGSGVRLENVSNVLTNKGSYTIAALFRFQTTTGYRKIMDFYNRSLDSGLYVLSSNLNFYSPSHTGSGTPIQPNQYVHVVLTRNADTQEVTGYVDGISQITFNDSTNRAVVNASDNLIFFQDDTATRGSEASAGAVARIQIYNGPLTSTQVAALSGHVLHVPVEGISLNVEELALLEGGDPINLEATITPANASNQEVIWSTSNESVATVDNQGLVTPLQAGNATITATAQDNEDIYAICEVTVSAVNRPPVAHSSTFSVSEGGTYNGAVSGSDLDGDSLTFALSTGPSYGTLIFNADGAFTYTAHRQPTVGFEGSDTFTFIANDGQANSDSAAVDITITPVNDAPEATSKSFTVVAGGNYSGTVSGTDVDGDDLSFILETNPEHGSLTFNADGSFEYNAGDHVGYIIFTFKAFDGLAHSDPATVSITIQAPLPTPATGVTLNFSELELVAGGNTATLVATVEPVDASNKGVVWSTSDESIATVLANSPAVVTPVGEGSAIITVTTEDGGFSAQCIVTVHAAVGEEQELPQTGGYPYYIIGLLALAGGVFTLSKKRKQGYFRP